jgi:hypothetical protein
MVQRVVQITWQEYGHKEMGLLLKFTTQNG